ncbi:MAG: galactose mutarotase, partial [Saprospiraceae bacterium]|nr:galactose mutarotase [Saprospiraceae bacterium]
MQQITREHFGFAPQGEVSVFTLDNGAGTRVRILNLGGIIQSIVTPDRHGQPGDVVLGYDHVQGYLKHEGFPYFGAIIGRYANRISNARFTLDGKVYHLNANLGAHTLHGGLSGFDQKIWDAEILEDDLGQFLQLSMVSPDGEEGFPGNLKVQVRYHLRFDNTLLIEYEATTDNATPVNLTNHTYFNLSAGQCKNILEHELILWGSQVTATDADNIPTGKLVPVAGTALDFSRFKPLGRDIAQAEHQGYDHNFVIDNTEEDTCPLIATVQDPLSGRQLIMFTSTP